MIELTVQSAEGSEGVGFEPTALIIAGWTGRDVVALEAHIRELEEIGIQRPRSVPIFYRVATSQLTTAPVVQVVGSEGSGEVEAVLFKYGKQLLVGVGSDYTDRKLEAVGITLSKQLCAKPIGSNAWRWTDVADHWDEVVLRSTIDGGVIYQEGAASALRRPDELVALYEAAHGMLPDGAVMFCGTLPAQGGIRFAERMTLELRDPLGARALRHDYRVEVLPIAEAVA